MNSKEPTLDAGTSDAHLVASSLAGDREAFSQIVSRYQSLICSLAYSATGSLSHSQDLAQETFVAGWKQLRTLREPAKLRAWLCQIARNHIYDALREQGREPSHGAEALDTAHESASLEPMPAEQAISKEEEAIMWRSLGKIPEAYREPLILFYREGHSVKRVAEELEVSEDVIKQRLSRGRKLLAEEVNAFVEGALKQSTPGRAFTLGVLAALPASTMSAKAAAIGITAAKGSTAAKAAAVTGLVGVLLSPLLVFFGMWAGYRSDLESGTSASERNFTKKFYRGLVGCIAGFFILYVVLMLFARPIAAINTWLLPGLLIGLALVYTTGIVVLTVWSVRKRRRVLADLEMQNAATKASRPAWEYRSKFKLFGFPFVHIRIGGNMLANRTPVKAWIAIGDCAFGLLFAFGGMAIAPLSIGGCAIGILPFGGFTIGVLAMGGLSIGVWSFGGLALGWQAFGGCALAWNAAMGGVAIAHEFALGGFAQAAQANNETAARFIQPQLFFKSATFAIRHMAWLQLLWVIPMFLWWRTVARRRKQQSS